MTHNLSSEASVGRIFLLVGFIMGIISSAVMLIVGGGMSAFLATSGETAPAMIIGVIYLVLGIILLVGTIITIFAYKAASNREFHQAGVLGIIGAIVGGLNIFSLVGAILCLVSKEAKNA